MKFLFLLLSILLVSCQNQEAADLAKQAEFRAADPLANPDDCDDDVDLTQAKAEVVDLSGRDSDEGCTLIE